MPTVEPSPDSAPRRSAPSVLAIAAHPDDIEFVMAGTLCRLGQLGWDLHYFNIANGCYGSMTLDRYACTATRLDEARRAAELMGAHFYPPICDDLAIVYTPELLAQVSAVVRTAKPKIVLTHSLADYMEDHQNAARLAVTAAFCRAMPNYRSTPDTPPYADDVTIYHAQPHGNRTPMGDIVRPSHLVDVTDLMDRKAEYLLAHASQGAWLDETQQISSYVSTMEGLNREVGAWSGGRFVLAEGWRRHLHLGLCAADADPLRDALGKHCWIDSGSDAPGTFEQDSVH
ncbi:MAG: PIG-L family deacetylase [Pirellulaceae bacterium]|nr:PIG-L family deacetylase [Pirellulaceae bacterium]